MGQANPFYTSLIRMSLRYMYLFFDDYCLLGQSVSLNQGHCLFSQLLSCHMSVQSVGCSVGQMVGHFSFGWLVHPSTCNWWSVSQSAVCLSLCLSFRLSFYSVCVIQFSQSVICLVLSPLSVCQTFFLTQLFCPNVCQWSNYVSTFLCSSRSGGPVRTTFLSRGPKTAWLSAVEGKRTSNTDLFFFLDLFVLAKT